MRRAGIYVTTALALCMLSGCIIAFSAVEGDFERILTVNGPVELDVTTGSGSIEVMEGGSGEVWIQATIKARSDSRASAEEKLEYLLSNPPIEQNGNRISIGRIEEKRYRNNVSISFKIVTPYDTRLESRNGSGSQKVLGIRGPVNAATGSGSISMKRIAGDVDAATGSGSINVDSVDGQTHLRTGSGSIKAERISGSVKANTGSGSITVKQTDSTLGPQRRVEAGTGSGSISVEGVTGYLKAGTGSGGITASGNPADDWSIGTSSGNVTLRISPDASFDLRIRTASGRINVDHPVTIRGSVGRRSLNGTVRGGGSVVDVHTSSGSITIH
ncbi:MAG: DUF4097 family beta strand repeat protein [Acidobacteria bacterium]|nr:DUF4097 family beta strand repeat protein [Acidobacteriota bacterium]